MKIMTRISSVFRLLRVKETVVALQRRHASCKHTTNLEWSYLSVPGGKPLLGLTVGQVVERAANLYGEKEALVEVHRDIRKTYAHLHQDTDAVAAGLLALGFQRGDRLGIWGPNSYGWVVTQFAAAKAGLVLVNINPAYRPEELKYSLRKVDVKGIICDEAFKTSIYYDLLTAIIPDLPDSKPGEINSSELPQLKSVIMLSTKHLPGTYRFQDLYGYGDSSHYDQLRRLVHKIQFDEPCNIQFTSGTTGLPKGAVLSHHNIVNNASSIGERCGYDSQETRICLTVPLFHCFGCIAGTLTSAIYGATAVIPSQGFDPKATVKSFETERITHCYGTPTMFIDVLEQYRVNPVRGSSLHGGIMAGAPCPQELVEALMVDLNMKDMVIIYGMTETSPVTFQCYVDDPPEIRSSTIGYPGDHIEVKVVDDSGCVIPTGQPGELWVRGYVNFLGYWDDQETTKDTVTHDGWLQTGDLAVLTNNGYGKIIGRIKDMVIRGGENIYPAEIENFYLGHPDVVEVQVFGVPDKRMGEEVAMWVRKAQGSNLTEENLKEWSKGKVAHFKIPKYILFRDDFPKTVTGKVQKFIMRKRTVEDLGLEC